MRCDEIGIGDTRSESPPRVKASADTHQGPTRAEGSQRAVTSANRIRAAGAEECVDLLDRDQPAGGDERVEFGHCPLDTARDSYTPFPPHGAQFSNIRPPASPRRGGDGERSRLRCAAGGPVSLNLYITYDYIPTPRSYAFRFRQPWKFGLFASSSEISKLTSGPYGLPVTAVPIGNTVFTSRVYCRISRRRSPRR